ncbi:MAG: thioredoxin family protein [Puniceicoccales bacterium]|nr:thioredoxin family protein [Puniceicoccales bacterium]
MKCEMAFRLRKSSLRLNAAQLRVSAVDELSDDNFDAFIGGTAVALVDFFAPWCGPCMAMLPAIESVADEFCGRAAVAKVNVDDCPLTAERFAIRAVPTLIFFRDGEAVEVVAGSRSRDDLVKKLSAHLR